MVSPVPILCPLATGLTPLAKCRILWNVQQGRQALLSQYFIHQIFIWDFFFYWIISSVSQWFHIWVTKRYEYEFGFSCRQDRGSERRISKETARVFLIRLIGLTCQLCSSNKYDKVLKYVSALEGKTHCDWDELCKLKLSNRIQRKYYLFIVND